MKQGFLIILLICLASGATLGQHLKRPNVLFIAVDDLRPQLGSYGDAVAITPNIDRLAKRGIVFNKAYCQQAVCGPSRASVLTGRRPDVTRVWDLNTHFREALPDVVTLPQYFKQQGYQARNVGKIYHDPLSAQDPISWSAPAQMNVTDAVGGKYVLSENKPRKGSWKKAATENADVPDSAYVDGQVCNAAIAVIRELKDSAFFLAVGFRRPHLPFSAPKRYWDLYQTGDIPEPAVNQAPVGVPEIALHDGVELRGYTDVPDSGPISVDKMRQLRHGYYASVSYVDAQIGRLFDELEEQHLMENTIIVLWSDHGFHLGELGLWGKTTNFERDTHVPLILSAPATERKGVRTDALVELVDIYPTLVELAGLPTPKLLDGISLVPLIHAPNRPWKKAVFSQFPRPWIKEKPTVMGYSVRTQDFRYTEWKNIRDGSVSATELYHYADGGIELKNLAGTSAQRKKQGEMQKLLDEGWRSALPDNK